MGQPSAEEAWEEHMRIRSLALATARFAALAAITPAAAQQAPAETQQPTTDEAAAPADPALSGDDTIVVTGIRRSLQSAQNIRRNSEQIVDSVVAEDIGKLPDLNTAQTAARIPGVQVYRQGGEASNVLVRGLPNFTTTYNGREIFTAETRVVALQDFPSSNIAALEVFKTSSADLVEPGLAGLINVRSRRPFDFSTGQIGGSVWGLYTRQGKELSPNFNFLATKRFDLPSGGEIGVLVNASRTEIDYRDAEISNTDFIADPIINGQRARFPDIQRLFYRSGNRVRPSVNGMIQYRPTPGLEFYAEGLWQGFRDKIDDSLLAIEYWRNIGASNLTFRPGTDLLQGGTFIIPGQQPGRDGGLFSFQGGTYNKTDTTQFAGGVRITRGPLRFNVDIARTDSKFTGSTESLDRRWRNDATITINTDRPRFEITGIDFSNPAEQQFLGLYEQNQLSAGDDWQFRADAQYDFEQSGFLRNVQAGVRYSTRDAERRFGDRFGGANALLTSIPVTNEVFKGVSDVGGVFEWSAPTYESIRANLAALRGLTGLSETPLTPGLLFLAEEKNLAGYVQLNVGNDVVDGSFGVRASKVETRVSPGVPTGVPTIDEGSDRTVVLPNASIRARVSPELQLRGAVSKTRTLPNFGDLNPSATLVRPSGGGTTGTPSDPFVLNGGNPFLRPYTSWNFDAAVEYYFARSSFVALTGFHRRIDGFIQPSSTNFQDPTLGTVRINGPVNTGKGRISGFELQGQAFADFEFLPDWARGFGVQANVTFIDAETQQPDAPGANPPLTYQPITGQLEGVSRWHYNLVGIYERNGLAARLTYNGRSNFRATRQLRGDDDYLEFGNPADRLDLSLNYDITNQFTVFGDWTNITRSLYSQNFSSARAGQPRAEFERYRRYDESTLSLGVRFRFGS
nr:TonB-dependent receptor [uncultured Sphingomonas sp.]